MSSIQYGTILGCLSDHEWKSREEIERQVGAPCMSQLTRLCGEGRVLHMIDASGPGWVHRYALPNKSNVSDALIGKSHVGRLARPVLEAAE